MVDFSLGRLLQAGRRHKYEPLHGGAASASIFTDSPSTQKKAALFITMISALAAVGLLVSG